MSRPADIPIPKAEIRHNLSTIERIVSGLRAWPFPQYVMTEILDDLDTVLDPYEKSAPGRWSSRTARMRRLICGPSSSARRPVPPSQATDSELIARMQEHLTRLASAVEELERDLAAVADQLASARRLAARDVPSEALSSWQHLRLMALAAQDLLNRLEPIA
ncbi:DUF6415 family natural product biosynthesis protein [Streptomyces sp. NPDC003016]